jgi:hypothetical protein
MENKLILGKGGKLYYDGIEALGFPTAHHLHECTLDFEDDVTLGDIFLYLKRDLYKWDELLGNWCKDYVREGLTPYLVKEKEEDYLPLDHLEVYRSIEIDKMDGEICLVGTDRLDFGGVGFYTKDQDGFKVGDKMGISVTFTPANELAQYPIKMKRDYEVWYHDYDKEFNRLDSVDPNPKKGYCVNNLEVTLFDFLYAIFWELSFFGGPEKRDLERDELSRRCKEALNNIDKES